MLRVLGFVDPPSNDMSNDFVQQHLMNEKTLKYFRQNLTNSSVHASFTYNVLRKVWEYQYTNNMIPTINCFLSSCFLLCVILHHFFKGIISHIPVITQFQGFTADNNKISMIDNKVT